MPTISTVVSVASSIATHIRPILLATSARFMREHQHLVHGVIEAQIGRRQPAGLELVADVARAEHAGGEADEGGEHDEDDVEVVDQQIAARRAGRSKNSDSAATKRQRRPPATLSRAVSR